MDGGILRTASKIKDICITLKALSNDGAFNSYRWVLFAQLQRLALKIGLEERFDDFDESEHPRAENGQFASKGGPARGWRKGDMKPENPVTFKNPKEMTKVRGNRIVTHFNHDDEEMKVEKSFELKDEFMDQHTLCEGDIKHLTLFAGKGASRKFERAADVARQYGGKAEDWKHVKGMGMVRDKDGVEREADIHWFENEDVGQAGWKIKQFRSDMGEGQIYWKDK